MQQQYIELTLIDSSSMNLYHLWSKIYMQLHLALAEYKEQHKRQDIGISFPEYQHCPERKFATLGSKLRLLATESNALEQLSLSDKLKRFSDYVHLSSVREVPQNKVKKYIVFARKKVVTNPEILARHRLKKLNDMTFSEAIERYKNRVSHSDLPFIQIQSLHSEQFFKLFIEKRTSALSSNIGFSTYGLSSKSTVPEF